MWNGRRPNGSCTKHNPDDSVDPGAVNMEPLEPASRVGWHGRLDFILSCLGYAVGLGNIVRFPYLCYSNGGGAFLVPYFLFLVIGGFPLVFLELSLGQYASLGPIQIWRLSPLFTGLGYGMIVVSTLVGVYYAMYVTWALLYMFISMRSPLPYTQCGQPWNTEFCCSAITYLENCTVNENSTCRVCTQLVYSENSTQLDDIQMYIENNTHLFNTSVHWVFPSEEYFNYKILGLTPSQYKAGPETYLDGTVQWELALTLVAVWCIIFICLIKGIRSSGKVVYFTVIFPYVLLLVFIIVAALLPGAKEGAIYYFMPAWGRLKDVKVWHDAANQIFFSLGPCYGGLMTLASYNKFSNNCYRDALVISIINSLTSILAGFAIFATLGYLSHQLGAPIEEVAESGPGLVYVIWPAGLSTMRGANVWSCLFFFMLVIVGLDSQFIFVHTITAAIVDTYPRKLHKKKVLVLLCVCLVMCLCGLTLTTTRGVYIIQILDRYSTGWSVLVIGLFECIAVGWVYGFSKFQHDIWLMTGKRPGKWWQVMWQVATPAYLLFVLVFSVAVYDPLAYHGVELSLGADIASWCIAALGTLVFVVYMIYKVIVTPGGFKERFRTVTKPSDSWGPTWEIPSLRGALLTLPDYMISEAEKKQGIANPVYVQPHSGMYDEVDSISVAEGYLHGRVGLQTEDHIDTGSIQWSEDENKERGNWTGRYDFLMSGLGYSVGIGNVWRFPYLVYKNGGGAFFFPYLVMLIFCGIPIFYLELAFGQFASTGPISIWKVSPIFKGLGYASTVSVFLTSIYYNMVNSWSVYYLFASMTTNLPWADCNNTWNTPNCRIRSEWQVNITCEYPMFVNNSTNETALCDDFDLDLTNQTSWNDTDLANQTRIKYVTPAEEYFFNYVLGLSPGIEHIGGIKWYLALCLLLCWLFTFIALIRGVKSVGKVVYLTVSFPYLILFILLIRYITVDSEAYMLGIKYYVTPQWDRLGDAQVWGDAASQLFFSLGLSQGGLIALGSYNRFHYDCYRDAYIVCIVDTLTSVFAGFVVFAILGVMAKEAGTGVDDVISSSFTLAFVVFPEAVLKLPAAYIWSVLIFLMLFSLAIDSHFLMVEAFITGIMDEFQDYIGKKRIWVIGVVCTVTYLLGLPMCTEGGLYILMLLDSYISALSAVLVGLMTCVVLSWVYKMDNFSANVKAMLGSEPSKWWQIMWKFVTPVVLLFILIFSWVQYKAPSYGDYIYPDWAHALALLTSVFSVMFIPGCAIVQVVRGFAKGKRTLCFAFTKQAAPDRLWGPALDKHRTASYLPGVVQVNPSQRIREWVEKGNYGNVFTTESSLTMAVNNADETVKHSVDKRKPSVPIAIEKTSKKKKKKRKNKDSPGGDSKPCPENDLENPTGTLDTVIGISPIKKLSSLAEDKLSSCSEETIPNASKTDTSPIITPTPAPRKQRSESRVKFRFSEVCDKYRPELAEDNKIFLVRKPKKPPPMQDVQIQTDSSFLQWHASPGEKSRLLSNGDVNKYTPTSHKIKKNGSKTKNKKQKQLTSTPNNKAFASISEKPYSAYENNALDLIGEPKNICEDSKQNKTITSQVKTDSQKVVTKCDPDLQKANSDSIRDSPNTHSKKVGALLMTKTETTIGDCVAKPNSHDFTKSELNGSCVVDQSCGTYGQDQCDSTAGNWNILQASCDIDNKRYDLCANTELCDTQVKVGINFTANSTFHESIPPKETSPPSDTHSLDNITNTHPTCPDVHPTSAGSISPTNAHQQRTSSTNACSDADIFTQLDQASKTDRSYITDVTLCASDSAQSNVTGCNTLSLDEPISNEQIMNNKSNTSGASPNALYASDTNNVSDRSVASSSESYVTCDSSSPVITGHAIADRTTLTKL